MQTFYWSTEGSLGFPGRAHFDNTETLQEWIDHHMDEYWVVEFQDESYAEVRSLDGKRWAVNASGAGDSYNHKVEFEELAA